MVASTTQLDFLAGDGEIESLIRAIDWSQTPLGPIAAWQQSLKISVRIVLSSRYPMFLWWGDELTLIYNEAYAKMTLAGKHPWAMGRPGQEVWTEIWDDVKPRIDTVMRLGQATWDEELMLILERRGFPEETYHTFSYSPIPDDHGGIGGVLCPVAEETKQVLGQRRLRTLRDLAEGTIEEAKSVASTCRTAIQVLTENPKDLPFALIYLLEDDQTHARLAESSGLPNDSAARQTSVDLTTVDARGWPLALAVESKRSELVTDLAAKFGDLPRTVWPDPPHSGLILPIRHSGQVELAGFLVVGLSPRLTLDDDYLGFLELVAGQIGTAIANARAYEAERQRAEALAELDRAKTTFFNNISHEFRTPLTLMLGPIEESLAEAYSPIERQRLELLHRNALRLQKLVNTLLDFSRMEAGRLQAFFEPTDLAALTRDLASVFRSAVEKAGMRLIIECPSLTEPIFVDRDKWEQIVLNLISNAFKFTLAGEIEVALHDLGDSVQLVVRDTGSGISAEQLPHIFERFHRVEGTRARTLEGTGIGLAFVSELARLHGGTVGVESRLGEGSTFTVTLPKGKAHLPAEQVGSERTAIPTLFQASRYVEEALRWLPDDDEAVTELPYLDGDGLPAEMVATRPRSAMRIVLADDNADMRDYVRRLLAEKYEVMAVGNGVDALEAVRQHTPDLLLTDVMMPQLDGFGLLHAIRSDEHLKTLPVIMLSARAGEEAKVEGLDAGADDYLVKPFGARELMARVGAQLELARVRREAMIALRASEARYRALATATTNSIFRATADGSRLVEVSGGELLQRPANEVPSVTWLEEYVHPEDQERVLHAWLSATSTQTLYEMENCARLQDGSWGWIHARAVPVRDEAGNVTEWIGSATDITARKAAEDALRESEERLRLAVQAGDIFTWEVDLATNQVTYSANVNDVMGFALSESTAGDRALLHPDDHDEMVAIFQRALAGKGDYNVEYRFIAPENGEIVWVRVKGLLISDPQGNRKRFLGITQNITERKKVEQELAAVYEQLAAELANIQRLHEVSMALQLEDDPDKLLERILDTAIDLTGADKGNMQMFNPLSGDLNIRSQRGFDAAFLDYFAQVPLDSKSACGETARSGSRTVVVDIQTSELYDAPARAVVMAAGVYSVQSTPLVTRSGQMLGMLSTHWRQRHEVDEREARMLDLLARAAADLIERSQSQDVLRQRAEEFKAHFNLTTVGNLQLDARNGRFVLVNQAMCEFTGYSEEELLQRTIWDITDSRDLANNQRVFQELVRGDYAAFELEKRYVRKDGEVRWGIVSVTVAQRDAEGKALRTGAVVLDITRRKQVEASLRESEERYRLLFEAMNEGFFVGEVICDDTGEPVDYYIREANTAMERILGHKREEMIGKRALSLFPTLNQDLMRIAGRVALTGEPADIEGYSPVLGWWYRSNVYSPRPRQFALVFVDMTERRRAETALQQLNETLERRVEERTAQVRESEERFRALIDASAQIVWTMDSHGRVIEDSSSWRDFTGQDFAEGRDWGWMEAVHPNDRERTRQNWRRAVRESVPMDTEFRVRHRNGEWYWMQVRAVPLYDNAGAVRGWVGMNIDIHERKQAEADRERLARSLMMAEQEERRRISQVLHDDLQQLLYATQMRMAMIVQDLEAVGQTGLQEEMDEARSWLRQCIETTRQMTVDLSPPILKNEGLADALEWLQPQMERRHGLKMMIDAVDRFPIADADLRALLFQIVRELLFNVAKHAGVDQVRVSLHYENGHLVIRVIDEGQGFDPKEVAERKPQKGGFGLFSVQERLRLVGGRMELDSQPGRGTRVVILAPVQTERLL